MRAIFPAKNERVDDYTDRPHNTIYQTEILITPSVDILQPSIISTSTGINDRDLEVSSIHPTNQPIMSANQTINLTQTLVNDPRAQLEPWLEEFETHAQNLCAHFLQETLLIAPVRRRTNPNPTPTTLRLL
jgi:hypothetical protein